jgi:hypothetical protein
VFRFSVKLILVTPLRTVHRNSLNGKLPKPKHHAIAIVTTTDNRKATKTPAVAELN